QRRAGRRHCGMKNHDGLDVGVGRKGIARGVHWRQRARQWYVRHSPPSRHRGKLFGALIDRDACRWHRIGIATGKPGFGTLLREPRRAERRAEPPPRAPFLQPVVPDDADNEYDTGDEQADKKRIHRDTAATCRGSVSASSNASAMSTATTRDTPGSGMVMPTS